ncbi:hypothetical protein F5Y06DRAFT_304509 [Hypoxylon sp. FL0890]|nr:hypothetical protein F5Y06DRAFT_304509 [Hypoxylon sp. FL0890]
MSPSPTQSSRSPASQPTFVGSRNSTRRMSHQPKASRAVDSNSKATITMPLSDKRLLAISSKTNALISKRIKVDKKIMREAKRDETSKPTLSDWPRRDKLLRKHHQLEKREKRHLTRLSQLESMYTQHSSSDHTHHRDTIKRLHAKFNALHRPALESRSGPTVEEMDSNDASQSFMAEQNPVDKTTSNRKDKRKSKKHNSDTSYEYKPSTNPRAEKEMSLDSAMPNNLSGENSHNTKRRSDSPSSKIHKKRKSSELSGEHQKISKHKERRHPDESMIHPINSPSLSSKESPGMSSKRRKKAGHETRRHSDAEVINLARSEPHSTEPARIRDEGRKRFKQHRRLSEIVRDHLEDNGTVYDRPNAQDILRRHRSAWLMSSPLISDHSKISHGTPSNSPSSLSSLSIPSGGEETSEDYGDDFDGWYDDDHTKNCSETRVLQNDGGENEGSGRQESTDEEIDGEGGNKYSGSHGPKYGGQKVSTPVGASSFQGNKYTPVPYSPRKAKQFSSPMLTSPTSPALDIKKTRRQSTSCPGPLQFAGPQPQQFFDRVMPDIAPTFAPSTPDPSGLANNSSKAESKPVKGISYTQDGKLLMPEYYSTPCGSKTPVPATEP